MSDYEDHQWSSGDMICHTLERETCHWLVLCFNQQSSFFRIQNAHSRVSNHIPDFMAKRIWDTRKKLNNSFLFWNFFCAIQNLKTHPIHLQMLQNPRVRFNFFLVNSDFQIKHSIEIFQHTHFILLFNPMTSLKVHSSAAKTPMFQLRPLSCSKIWTMDWSMNRWMQGRL